MSAPSRDFHPLLRLLHWAMAAITIAMLFIGVGMVSTAGSLYPSLLAWHRPLGLLLLLLLLVRLPLRLATGTPSLPDDFPRALRIAARASHIGLYASMAAMPLIGWAMLSAGGYPVEMVKGAILPPLMGRDLALFAILRETHKIIAFLFFGLVVGHLGAALVHGLIRRDGVLRAMTIGHLPVASPACSEEAAAPAADHDPAVESLNREE